MTDAHQHILTECIAIHGQVNELRTNSEVLLAALKTNNAEMAHQNATTRQDPLATLDREPHSPSHSPKSPLAP